MFIWTAWALNATASLMINRKRHRDIQEKKHEGRSRD